MSLVCPTCGKNFSQTSACERHIRSVHENPEERFFKCSLCKKGFKRRDNLQVHTDSVHLRKVGKVHKRKCPWPLCNYYCAPTNLKIHMSRIHVDDREPEYACTLCSLTYYTKRALMGHEKRDHGIVEQKEKKAQNCTKSCPLCNFTAVGFHSNVKEIMYCHFKNEHNVDLNWEKLIFDSLSEFYAWKQDIESQTSDLFSSIYTGDIRKEKKGSKLIHTFVCNRSGYSRTKGCGKRSSKLQGSGKINAFCPAVMKVREGIDKEIQVSFLNVHLGHEVNQTEHDDLADFNSVSLQSNEKKSNKVAAKGPILLKIYKSEFASKRGSDSLSIKNEEPEIKILKEEQDLENREVFSVGVNNNITIENKTPDDDLSMEEQVLEVETIVEEEHSLDEESTSVIENNVPYFEVSVEELNKADTFEEVEISVTGETSSSVNDNIKDNVVSKVPACDTSSSSEEQLCDGAVIAVEIANNVALADIFKEIAQFAAGGKLQRIQLTVSGQDCASQNTKYLYINQSNTVFSKFEELRSTVIVKIEDR